MAEIPEVRYARCGEVNVAYQRWGQGDRVQVFVPPLVSNLEVMWELPEFEGLYRRAGRVLDTMMFDKRGMGLSDRISEPVTFDTHAEDLITILDTEGAAEAGLVGFSEGGIIALVAAAQYPERITSVVTEGTPVMGADAATLARFADPDNPPPDTEEQAERYRSLIRGWATPESTSLELVAPGASQKPHLRDWYTRYERQSASPGAIRNHLRAQAGFDLRPYLPRVRCRTLVMHAIHDRLNHVTHGRLLASLLPDAQLREFEGDAHFFVLTHPDVFDLQDEIEGWTLGQIPDRGVSAVFATVLFTDIIDSTVRASDLGDRAWKQLIDLHDAITTHVTTDYGGRVVKTTGDGVLATFGDPAQAIDAAVRMRDQLAGSGIPIRAGLHIGHVELRDDGDIAGIAVNIAARVEARADDGEILVSQTLRDMLMGTSHTFTDAGEHHLKGVDGTWRLHRLEPAS